jgi:uncharacterized protein
MLKLTQINIFPVKSLDGFSPKTAVVEKRGLQHDREYMLCDENGLFQTLRTNGRMANLRATIEGVNLKIESKTNPAQYILVPLAWEAAERTVQIWDDTVLARHTTPEADAFLSDFLGKKVHLVKMPQTTLRAVDARFNSGADIVSFADGYPILIVGESSMTDLNSRLPEPLSLRRFRANFIFSGGKPFEEDTFEHFCIGAVNFKGVKPCARCVLITRDPDSGVKTAEPLKTLQTYRQEGLKTLFGMNVIWDNSAWESAENPTISVGDIIN